MVPSPPRIDPEADICYCEAKHVQSFYAAIAKGAKTFNLPKGNINFNASDFLVAGASGMTIKGAPSTTLWFNVGAGMVRAGTDRPLIDPRVRFGIR